MGALSYRILTWTRGDTSIAPLVFSIRAKYCHFHFKVVHLSIYWGSGNDYSLFIRDFFNLIFSWSRSALTLFHKSLASWEARLRNRSILLVYPILSRAWCRLEIHLWTFTARLHYCWFGSFLDFPWVVRTRPNIRVLDSNKLSRGSRYIKRVIFLS